MKCPKCQTELRDEPASAGKPAGEARPSEAPREGTSHTPEESYRADTPPGPCPKCGWSTMWNE